VLAKIGDNPITFGDVERVAANDLSRVETQYQLIRSQIIEAALDSLIRERTIGAEAKKQGKSFDELVVLEAGDRATPGEADIAAWFDANRNRTGGRSLEELKPQIADLIRQERLESATRKLVSRLTAEKKVKVYFEPYRHVLRNEGAPRKGNARAPVTLVEFSDFQCPFCQRFFQTLNQIERDYGQNVSIIYRQFPIESIHPFAVPAAEASLCANDQGKFWEFHDAMFTDQAHIALSDLRAKASTLGIDRRKFDECVESRRFKEQVQKDIAEGARLGVNGTPAIFVNGIELRGGAVPYAAVAAAIDKELSRASNR
jgi:protein-disulfide isomerase